MKESLAALDPHRIFKEIRYHDSLEHLPFRQREQFFSNIQQTVTGLAQIKHDLPYRLFLTHELGYNLERSFANLAQTPLNIACCDDDIEMGATIAPGNQLVLEIAAAPVYLQHHSSTITQLDIAHELGHQLAFGAQYGFTADQRNNQPRMTSYSRNIAQNWQNEFDADRFAVAINPRNKPASALNDKHPLNALYQKGLLPQFIAEPLSQFCQWRNIKMFLSYQKHTPDMTDRQIGFLNNALMALDLGVSPYHPPPLSRAVEGQKFARKIDNFLNNPKA